MVLLALLVVLLALGACVTHGWSADSRDAGYSAGRLSDRRIPPQEVRR
jgi:hypothetical protein